MPANLIGADFDGQVLRPDPPVRRELAAYCRGEGDPLTAAFVECLTANATLMPGHVLSALPRDRR